ncbi:MAG: hypothetical protein J0G34_10115 [Afipia sp.]|nr:hypothetical protein [Afipia sp.]
MKTAIALLLFIGSAFLAPQIHAQGWADFATVSMTNVTTPKLTANRICYTDGLDIACDGAAGLLTTSGSLIISTVNTGGLSVTGNTSLAAVSVTDVSATGNVSAVKFIGDGSLLTGVSGGGISSATTAVAFSVNKGGVSQTVTGTASKLSFGTEDSDTNSNFASDRFTPTVAGKYLLVLKIQCGATNGSTYYGSGYISSCDAFLYKNGASVAAGSYGSDGSDGEHIGAMLVAILDMNGSTDYVEAYGASTSTLGLTLQVAGNNKGTYFQGALLGPGQTSSSGGGSSSTDRIVAINANAVAMPGGTISFTTGGVSGTTYFDTTGRHILPGISTTTNQSSFTTIYASDKVGIGRAPGTAMLSISGSTSSGFSYVRGDARDARITVGDVSQSWSIASGWSNAGHFSLIQENVAGDRISVGLSGNVGVGVSSPTTKLEVAGTVSATSFSMGWERITGSAGTSSIATCSAGKQVIGGGCLMGAYNASYGTGGFRCSYSLYGIDYYTPISNYPSSATQWTCGCPSGVPASGAVTSYAICTRVQ